MIRRQVGKEFWLITQDDHAHLSGDLAALLKIRPTKTVVQAIKMHDSGWPLHDDRPTLNASGVPLDVFESPRSITMVVWERSVENAMAADPYAGLLVSLHVLGLSIYAVEQSAKTESSWNLKDSRARFEINRFQHRMIEIQETLRQELGMHTDRPLKHGLSDDSSDPGEVKLRQDFNWLRAMDQLSLCMCCTSPPVQRLETVGIDLQWTSTVIGLKPWPFVQPRIQVQIPFRRFPGCVYTDAHEFQERFSAAPCERFTVGLEEFTI